MHGTTEPKVTGNEGAATTEGVNTKRQRRGRIEKKLPLVARFQEKNLRNISQVVVPCSLKNQYCRNAHLEAILQTARTKYLHNVNIVIMLNDIIYSVNELFSKANPNPQAFDRDIDKLAHGSGDITMAELHLIRGLAEGEMTLHAHEAGNDWLTNNQAIINEYIKGAHPVDRFEDITSLPLFTPTLKELTNLYFSNTNFKAAFDASTKKRLDTVQADHNRTKKAFHERLFRACSLAFLLYECAGFVAYTLTHQKEDFLYYDEIFEALRVTREHFIVPKNPNLLRWHQVQFVNDEAELENQTPIQPSLASAFQLQLPVSTYTSRGASSSSSAYPALYLPSTTQVPENKSSSASTPATISPRVQVEVTLIIGLLIKVMAPKLQEELQPIIKEIPPELTLTVINGVLSQLREVCLQSIPTANRNIVGVVGGHTTNRLQAAQPDQHASSLQQAEQRPIIAPTPKREQPFLPTTGSPIRKRLTSEPQRPASSPPTFELQLGLSVPTSK